jgi:hypothetical protein
MDGGGGGTSATARTRRLSEDAEITVFERGPHVSFANRGLPAQKSGQKLWACGWRRKAQAGHALPAARQAGHEAPTMKTLDADGASAARSNAGRARLLSSLRRFCLQEITARREPRPTGKELISPTSKPPGRRRISARCGFANPRLARSRPPARSCRPLPHFAGQSPFGVPRTAQANRLESLRYEHAGEQFGLAAGGGRSTVAPFTKDQP